MVAVAECFRGDGERLCNPIGTIPMIGGRLARETFEPHLVMTDGFAMFTSSMLPPGANPYSSDGGPLVQIEPSSRRGTRTRRCSPCCGTAGAT